MIARSGRKVEIVFTGLRDGEKLHEELLGDGEHDERRIHPSISHTHIEPMGPERLLYGEWNYRLLTGGVFTGELHFGDAPSPVRISGWRLPDPRSESRENDLGVAPS
jgi:hypothetical protein